MGEHELDPLVRTYKEGYEWSKRILKGQPRDLREFFVESNLVTSSSDTLNYVEWSGWNPSPQQIAVERFFNYHMSFDSSLEDIMNDEEDVDASTAFSIQGIKYAIFHPEAKDSPLLSSMYELICRVGKDERLDNGTLTEKLIKPLMAEIHPSHFAMVGPSYKYSRDMFSMGLRDEEKTYHYYRCDVSTFDPGKVFLESMKEVRDSSPQLTFLPVNTIKFISQAHFNRVIQPPTELVEAVGEEERDVKLSRVYLSLLPEEERYPDKDNLGLYARTLLREQLEPVGSSIDEFITQVITPNLFAITPRKLSEFISLVEEYNLEWARAAYDWGDSYGLGG